MRLYYNEKDITDHVTVTGAVGYDVSGGSCDHVIVELDEARKWYAWQPQMDDMIEIVNGRYSSGAMYINTIFPSDGKYRILATAIPSNARNRSHAAYYGMTIGQIVSACASESGMNGKVYGISENLYYDYLLRENESAAAFLERVAHMENAVLKCWNGQYTIIGIEAAQEIEPMQTIYIDPYQDGVSYARMNDQRIKLLTVASVNGEYTAIDSGAEGHLRVIRTDLPVTRYDQAVRWARGMLTHRNRKWETLRVRSEFNAGWTAMARIDISGETDANGEWIIDSVTHDFIAGNSEADLRRVIRTVN